MSIKIAILGLVSFGIGIGIGKLLVMWLAV